MTLSKVSLINSHDIVSIAESSIIPILGTPPIVLAPSVNVPKRASRSNPRKGKGKNQYTKEREVEPDESPARSMSRDIQRQGDESVTLGPTRQQNEHKFGTKTKSTLANKMSMLDMKRRVSAIMDFISRTQVDLATEATFIRRIDSGINVRPANGCNLNKAAEEHMTITPSGSGTELSFKDLSCLEMMDVLTRDMVKWQNQYL